MKCRQESQRLTFTRLRKTYIPYVPRGKSRVRVGAWGGGRMPETSTKGNSFPGEG